MTSVTVYSAPWCAFCKAAKVFLQSHSVPFTEVNIEQDPQAAEHISAKTHQMGVPVIAVGSTYVVGFNKQELEGTLRAEGLLQ